VAETAADRYLRDPQYAAKIDRQLAVMVKTILLDESAPADVKAGAQWLLEKYHLKDLMD
jgi:hypothetical protein